MDEPNEDEKELRILFDKMLTLCLAFALVVAGFMYADTAEAQAVTNGLVAYWSFDEQDIDGNTAKDFTGNYDGMIVGNAQEVEGKVGGALLFNEKTLAGDHVDAGLEINEKLKKELTVEGWFKFEQRVDGIVHVMMCARTGGWAASIHGL